MNYDVFISYKRKSLPTANNLYYRLTTRGYSTFFDLEEMGRDNFNVQLLNYIENAKDVFVILEEGSLDGCKQGNWEEKDWFCHEIAFALEKKKNIIPILLNGYQMPSQDFFPDSLKELSLKNAPEFNFSFFEAYLDKTGKIVIPIKYDFVSSFDENELALVKKDGKYGYINRWGREIIPLEYDDIEFSFYEYLCSAKKDGKYAVVDVKGRLITSFLYDDISIFFGGVAKFKLDDQWGLLNSVGETIIPNEYEEIGFAYDELVLAKKYGKCGFLSLNDETIIPFEYDSAHIFRDGLAPVCINHRWGYINKQNEKVIPLKYDMATPFSEYGLAVVKINGETHYIDKGGELYIYDPELLK